MQMSLPWRGLRLAAEGRGHGKAVAGKRLPVQVFLIMDMKVPLDKRADNTSDTIGYGAGTFKKKRGGTGVVKAHAR
jgi:hypothetical protein